MARAHKLPSGNWRCMADITINGKRVRKSFTAPSKREAELMAAEFIHEGAQIGADCLVKHALDNYITNRTNTISPSTVRTYRQYQNNYYSSVENFRVSTITSEDLQRFVNSIAADHSPKTVRNIYGLLASSIRATAPNKTITVNLPQKQQYEYHIPTDADVKLLLSEADDLLRLAILLTSIGTMRRGEICALEYSDINGRSIHVHRDKVRKPGGGWIIKDMPKTSGSDRYIEYPQQVIDAIGTGNGLIIDISPDAVTSRFQKLKKRLGIKCRFHDLRHYAASIMHAIGVPDQYIMEVGGWSSDAVLKAVYRNVLDDKQREFTDRRNMYFEDNFFE